MHLLQRTRSHNVIVMRFKSVCNVEVEEASCQGIFMQAARFDGSLPLTEGPAVTCSPRGSRNHACLYFEQMLCFIVWRNGVRAYTNVLDVGT